VDWKDHAGRERVRRELRGREMRRTRERRSDEEVGA
jgi:hypothetical protein